MSTGTLPTTNPNADKTSVTEAITRSRWAPFRSFFISLINLSLFFVGWQLLALSEVINPLFFPKATDMFSAMYHGFVDGIIGPQLLHSVKNFTIGMLIAAAIGIPRRAVDGRRSDHRPDPVALRVGDDVVAARRAHSAADPRSRLRQLDAAAPSSCCRPSFRSWSTAWRG